MFLSKEKEKLLKELLDEEFNICLEKAKQMTIFEFVDNNLINIGSNVNKGTLYTYVHGVKFYWNEETKQFSGYVIGVP